MFITGKFFPRLISILIFFSIFYVPSLAWAELKPGDIITKDNWEKVKDIAPKLVLDAVKKGGYPLKIIEMPFLYPEEYWEATRKYSGAVKLDADGGLVNYVAGLPFGTKIDPNDPHAAIKIGWNMYRRWWGDDDQYTIVPGAGLSTTPTMSNPYTNICRRWCTDKRGNEIIADLMAWILRPTGRIRVDPKPVIKGCEKIEWLRYYRSLSPRDVAGTSSLEIRYWDPKKGDDMWLYIPSIRRVRRIPTNQRSSTRAPADYSWDDSGGFYGKVPRFDWKLLGEAKRLAPRSKHIPVQHKKGSCLPIDDEWSVHDCWIIEHTPKDPHYGIPKRIEYIEKGTFNLIDWYLYDKKGELWKNFTMPFIRVSEIGTVADMTGGCWAYDYQTGHHTLVGARQQTVDAGLRRDSFTVTNILRVSKGQQSFR